MSLISVTIGNESCVIRLQFVEAQDQSGTASKVKTVSKQQTHFLCKINRRYRDKFKIIFSSANTFIDGIYH